ncbi:transcription-repair coupling factor [bacterium]|nr:transcription-repair coupling factor [candidate division CSSED10-310 bacterium]
MMQLWENEPILIDLVRAVTDSAGPVSVICTAGPATASFVASVHRHLNKPVAIVTSDASTAATWWKDLRFFLAEPGRAMLADETRSAEPSIRENAAGSVILFPSPNTDGDPDAVLNFKSHAASSFYGLSSHPCPVSILPAGFLTVRCPEKSTFTDSRILLHSGDSFGVDRFVRQLPGWGYEPQPRVQEPGEFSFRGGILDIYVPIYRMPVRMEFFGDEIVSIREFDPLTQRSISRLKTVNIVPVSDPDRSAPDTPFLWQMEKWFHPETILFWVDTKGILEILSRSGERFGTVPDRRKLPGSRAVFMDLIEIPPEPGERRFYLNVSSVPEFKGEFKLFVDRLIGWLDDGYRVRLVYHRESVRKVLEDRISEFEFDFETKRQPGLRIEEKARFVPGMLSGGFILPDQRWVLLSESDIIGRKKTQSWRPAEPEPGLAFHDLKPDDFVVHTDHGIGQYLGLKRLTVDGRARDFLSILYAENQKLYLPVDRLDLIQRYVAPRGTRPSVDRMGGVTFSRRKKKVRESVLKLAAELLKLFSHREIIPGHSFSPDNTWDREFDLGFEYEETPDQTRAIGAVKQDMEQPRPMDRLVCGDVGYGKTEVAMRAAFKAASRGKQVAVLVPTTILAQQHFRSFIRRFESFPLQIAMLSRFLRIRDAGIVKKGLSDGTVDIVIGTHSILSEDVTFKDLGLVIIDEEHRFGVRHKERLKQLRTKVDVLALSATPIPRTLNMTLLGIRDITLINTPPEARKPILTRVVRFDRELIRNAILAEIKRDGQIYFVHNRIQSISSLTELLRKLIPEARFEIAHGQMPEKQLEHIMLRFLDREFEVLVSTTIIESGLDIPSVNTIIVNRADRLGMAQLYQLRGRVGRERTQAYAYLMVPPSAGVTSEARERLAAIREASELGSGIKLASRDLEIRGAGDILGSNQHGNITAVGYEMYCRLIREAVRELRGDLTEEIREPEIKLPVDTTLPDTYIPASMDQLEIYRRFSTAVTGRQVDEIVKDIGDRYGEIPQPVYVIREMTLLKIICRNLMIAAIESEKTTARITFLDRTTVRPESITSLLLRSPGHIRFDPPSVLKIMLRGKHDLEDLRFIREVLNGLAG